MSVGRSAADLEAWLDRAFSREATGSYDDLKLGPLRQVMDRLPPPPAPITFAGTKGKGSTLHLVERILLAHGETCLAFTSPHISSVLERWRLDGVPLDPAVAGAAAERIDAIEAETGAALTYFERCFAIAAVVAAERPGCRFLCEVGLGGRLDCANLLDAAIAVCTHLSRDHCTVLGDTLELIAGEKLAIARPGRPLVIAPQSPAAEAAVRTRLSDAPQTPGVPQAKVMWVAVDPALSEWPLGLRGAHQRESLATAVQVARLALGERYDPALARASAAAAALPARCQLIDDPRRPVLVDGAHNGPSVAATLREARALWGSDFTLIIGLASDKELAEVLAAIPDGPRVLRCGYRGPRARGESAWGAGARWPWYPDVTAALAAAPAEGPICITGSFYLAAEALAALSC